MKIIIGLCWMFWEQLWRCVDLIGVAQITKDQYLSIQRVLKNHKGKSSQEKYAVIAPILAGSLPFSGIQPAVSPVSAPIASPAGPSDSVSPPIAAVVASSSATVDVSAAALSRSTSSLAALLSQPLPCGAVSLSSADTDTVVQALQMRVRTLESQLHARFESQAKQLLVDRKQACIVVLA
jgi:hypothetical protein